MVFTEMMLASSAMRVGDAMLTLMASEDLTMNSFRRVSVCVFVYFSQLVIHGLDNSIERGLEG